MPIIIDGDNQYFTAAEFRERYTDLATKTDDEIDGAREIAELAYEDSIGYALVPRTATGLSLGPTTTRTIHLPHRYVREITAATDRDGDTVTIADAVYDGTSYVDMLGGWGAGHPVTVTYTHGKDAPDALDVRAVMTLTHHFLTSANSKVDDRATGLANDMGIVDLTVWPREVNRAIELRRIPSIA